MENASPDTDPRVLSDLALSLDGCKTLIKSLVDRLHRLEYNEAKVLGMRKRVQVIWGEKERTDFLTLLNHNVAALQLFLTAIQCQTQSQQIDLLQKTVNRDIVPQARDDSSSLLWLRDDESLGTRRSVCTENSDFLDFSFSFDEEIFGSRIYLAALKSSMKRVVRDAHLKPWAKRNMTRTVSGGRTFNDDKETINDGSSFVDSDSPCDITAENLNQTTLLRQTSTFPDKESSGPAQMRRQAFGVTGLSRLRSFTSSQTSLESTVGSIKSSCSVEERILLVGNAACVGAQLLQSLHLAFEKEYEESDIMEDSIRETVITRKSLGVRRKYRFFDVLGLHSAKDKWLFSTRDTSALIFVVDLSTYNLQAVEDQSAACVLQDLALFKQICATKWLGAIPVLLLLSGIDRLASKLPRYPLTNYFPDYPDGHVGVESAKLFFQQKFLALDMRCEMRIRVVYTEHIATRKLGQNVVDRLDKMLTERKVLTFVSL
ncbi:MAG: hypothetical protein Q9228_001678 [Teloschistes exilis]